MKPSREKQHQLGNMKLPKLNPTTFSEESTLAVFEHALKVERMVSKTGRKQSMQPNNPPNIPSFRDAVSQRYARSRYIKQICIYARERSLTSASVKKGRWHHIKTKAGSAEMMVHKSTFDCLSGARAGKKNVKEKKSRSQSELWDCYWLLLACCCCPSVMIRSRANYSVI